MSVDPDDKLYWLRLPAWDQERLGELLAEFSNRGAPPPDWGDMESDDRLRKWWAEAIDELANASTYKPGDWLWVIVNGEPVQDGASRRYVELAGAWGMRSSSFVLFRWLELSELTGHLADLALMVGHRKLREVLGYVIQLPCELIHLATELTAIRLTSSVPTGDSLSLTGLGTIHRLVSPVRITMGSASPSSRFFSQR